MAVGSTVSKFLPARPGQRSTATAQAGALPLRFEDVYAEWVPHVYRWIRAFGGLNADLDDLAQEVFMVVRRKLPEFDGANLAGWLYRITQRTVRDHRGKAWFRRFLLKKNVQPLEEDPPLTPAEELERREAERALVQILKDMTETRRTAFILFELEGYSGEEIAELEGVPVNTVWTRLHHARKDFSSLIARAREEGRLP